MKPTTLKILSVSPEDRSLVVEWNGDPDTRWVCGVPARFDRASLSADFVVWALAQACFDQLVAEEADAPAGWSALNGLVGKELDASAAIETQIRQRRRLGRRAAAGP